MRDRFPGYYRPTDEQFEAFFNDGLICPDTSVLLSLYRVSQQTQDDVLSLFGAMGERLWLPHQVALEFQRNRRQVIREQGDVYGQLKQEIEAFPARLTNKVRRHHPRIDKEELSQVVRSAMDKVEEYLDGLREAHTDPLETDDVLGADVVRDRLDEIIGDRVGEAVDGDRLEKEGKSRYPRRVPPGYADSGKDDAREYGDLAVWLELLEEANRRSGPVVFVTEDAKEDWWLLDAGETVAPRPELVQEMRDQAGCEFWMYRFEPFLSYAAEHFGVELGATAGAEVADAQRAFSYEGSFENWNRFPAGQERFPLSPENPLAGSWAQNRNPGQLEWRSQLESQAEVGADFVRLSIQSPTLIGSQLLCSVTGPNGWIGNAEVFPLGDVASVDFPGNFENARGLEPGIYQYNWSTRAVPETPLRVVVAHGTFSVV